nr:MAG TPA: hypothetical protein [Caudoviricetes sp.]
MSFDKYILLHLSEKVKFIFYCAKVMKFYIKIIVFLSKYTNVEK